MSVPSAVWLDLGAEVGQRSASFSYRLVETATGAVVRDPITPLVSSTPELSHDTTAAIKRRVSGFALGPDDSAVLDPIAHRVEIWMVLGNAGRTRYPLGRYLFVEGNVEPNTRGDRFGGQLFDEMLIVDQQIEHAFAATGRAEDAIRDLLVGLPILPPIIEGVPGGVVVNNSWPAGTYRGQILDWLCTQAGYLTPWFDHTGQMRIVPTFDPATRVPDIDLDAEQRIIEGSILRPVDLISAPNRFIVFSTEEALAGQSAVYEVPATAPYSIARRGFVIPAVYELEIFSVAGLKEAARTIGLTEQVAERAELSTSPDPRHDSYQVIQYDGARWLEIGWSMRLAEGEPMRHTLRRAYE